MIDKNIDYYLGFSYFDGIGPMRLQALIARFGTAKKAYEADSKDLKTVLPQKLADAFLIFRSTFDSVKELEMLKKKNIRMVCLEDKAYPSQLRNISDPPICLYVKGKSNLVDSVTRDASLLRGSTENTPQSASRRVSSLVTPAKFDEKITFDSSSMLFAIVGTRTPTPYGEQIAKKFATELAAAGFVIVSGMAMGIDAISHWGALEAGGQTIAVLGCGVEVVYPAVNRRLYETIVNGKGAVISEFPPGRTVEKGLFIARNRIISGLSKGVLIIEGLKDSGALITARYAAEQGKEVFASPGPITSPLSQAPHLLLKQGAKLVTSVEDIFEELGLRLVPKKKEEIEIQLDHQEKEIFQALQKESLLIDEIAMQIHQPIHQVLNIISLLEIKGIIEKNSEGKYQVKL